MKTAKQEAKFEKGDTIIYQYTHWLNSRSFTTITKKGEFLRYVNSKNKTLYPNYIVKLEGNKNNSTVGENTLRLASHIY